MDTAPLLWLDPGLIILRSTSSSSNRSIECVSFAARDASRLRRQLTNRIAILFEERFKPRFVRLVLAFARRSQPMPLSSQIAGAGGVLYHCNRPYGDIYRAITEPFRRLAACGRTPKIPLACARGSVDATRYRAAIAKERLLPRAARACLVQELKAVCRTAGSMPSARCNINNLPSRRILQKSGFVPCGALIAPVVSFEDAGRKACFTRARANANAARAASTYMWATGSGICACGVERRQRRMRPMRCAAPSRYR